MNRVYRIIYRVFRYWTSVWLIILHCIRYDCLRFRFHMHSCPLSILSCPLSLCPSFSNLRLPPSLSLCFVYLFYQLSMIFSIFNEFSLFSLLVEWCTHAACLACCLSPTFSLSRSLFRSLTLSDRWHCLPLFLLLFLLPTLPLSACLSSLSSLLISLRQCIIIKH